MYIASINRFPIREPKILVPSSHSFGQANIPTVPYHDAPVGRTCHRVRHLSSLLSVISDGRGGEGALNVGKTLGAQKSQLYGSGQDRASESDGGLIDIFLELCCAP